MISVYDSSAENIVIMYNRKDHYSVHSIYENNGYKYDDKLHMCINIANKVYEVELFSKNKPKYKAVSYLREVLAPYMKDGKARGWQYDVDHKPIRYSSLANSFYVDNLYEAIYIIKKCFCFDDLYLYKDDNRTTKEDIENNINNDKYIEYRYIYSEDEEKYLEKLKVNRWHN